MSGGERQALFDALERAGLPAVVQQCKPLAGGCIHSVESITLADGTRLVAKHAPVAQRALLEEQRSGLDTLAATGAVLVPEVLALGTARDEVVLLMSQLEPAAASDIVWRRFGRDLARLHTWTSNDGRYGFEADNHLGTTPQPNGWSDDWISFNAIQRIGHQLHLARDGGRLSSTETRTIDSLIDRLDRHLPASPPASLLHGDLWSGNALSVAGERIAVIDPACSYGDGWADIAMMTLFGGFPAACLDTYAEEVGRPDGVASRIGVYQLYHLLNHVNLFGAGYVEQAMATARQLA